ncbi:MAG: DEAD/DEAH box helicase [Bacteroidales bacterium]|nr:DEAD/DEAH box helicase [Bacteroidales bacterium]
MPNFQELGLNPELLKAVEALGFAEPMPVQAAVIPILLEKATDLVGLAQTGTGKTAAFGLPVLQYMDTDLRQTQAVILCPTRELCMQISRDLASFAQFMPKIKIVPIYGGASIEVQMKQLYDNPHIIVATPGRMNDMIRRGKVNLTFVKWAVLDEADEMLDMGFQEDVDSILQEMPKGKNTLLFSATMPDQVERILSKYMNKPVIKTVGDRNAGTANVKHMYYMVQARDRYPALKRLADFNPSIYAIVFCRTRIETQEIADSLIRDGYNADSLHGDLSQAQRDHVMNRFRNGTLQMLVATDVAARGLDVNNLTHVINYNLPDEPEVYIHRSGRTGRADKTGICFSIINMKEKGKIRLIERKVGREFAKAKIPTGVQVCEKQLFHHIDRMEKVQLNHEEIDSFLPVIYRKLEWMDREEIIKRFVALEFNRFLEYYRDAQDLNIDESKSSFRERDDRGSREGGRFGKEARWESRESRGGGKREGGRSSGGNFKRMFFSIGRKDSIAPPGIIGLINEVTRSRDVTIGRIDILDNFSFVDVDAASVDTVLEAFANKTRNTKGIRVDIAGDREEGSAKPKRRDEGGFKPYSGAKPEKRRPRPSGSDRRKGNRE